LPLDPACYSTLLRRALRRMPTDADRPAVLALVAAFDKLAPHDTPHAHLRRQRQTEKTALKVRLAALAQASSALCAAIDALLLWVAKR
jgi:hypothetical protein